MPEMEDSRPHLELRREEPVVERAVRYFVENYRSWRPYGGGIGRKRTAARVEPRPTSRAHEPYQW